MGTPIIVTIGLAILGIALYISNKRNINNNIIISKKNCDAIENKVLAIDTRISNNIITLLNSQKDTEADLKRTREEIEEDNKELTAQIDESGRVAQEYTDKKYSSLSFEMKKQIATLSKAVEKLAEENRRLKAEIDRLKFTSSAEIEKDSKNLNDEYQLPHKADTTILLDPEQESACKTMNQTDENMFITGKAGTGKSFLLESFKNSTNKSYVVLAPTGIAALNVGGSTLHSAFGYYNLETLSVDEITKDSIHLNSNKKIFLQQVQTIIIDEISMVRADIFEKIDRILKVLNDTKKPFGGKQMFVFGDLFQLPPVAEEPVKKFLAAKFGGVYFFNSNAYLAGNFKYIELKQNHRQESDSKFFELLNAIREGNKSQDTLDILNSRVSSESMYDRFTTLVPTRAEAEAINNQHLDALNLEEYTYEAKVVLNKLEISGDALSKAFQRTFPTAQTLRLCKGALVMMVANDPEHRWVNGTMGIVNGLTSDAIFVSIEGHTYEVFPTEFTQQDITIEDSKIVYTDVLKIVQYPLVLAYAITIHKSQGQTFKNIVCDVEKCFANGQAYVALSRCTSLEGLHLKNKVTAAAIKVAYEVIEFSRNHTMNSDILN